MHKFHWTCSRLALLLVIVVAVGRPVASELKKSCRPGNKCSLQVQPWSRPCTHVNGCGGGHSQGN
ncbi:hypothetical protein PGT21_023350 [Puccinia graminis f. sp. tritici]|uniref:Secreted protein n=1 Tax=Puccinia graminis f. sp. tritici TaxID=56615 RepID=A0A5B0RT86_PUCGR|nr:hypothetical protein PGT21_023350 [Puccinia graminis f. sp. tritici]KAA1129090.1 hypothetical protein PGTUg99_028658 [Puccinia graminis f. sp. tritici]